jgi:sugar phosphate isomerase/epimerase
MEAPSMFSASRRDFLKGSAASAALVAGAPHRLWAAGSPQPLGLQLYTVAQALEKDVPGTLEKVKAIGYAEVETAGLAGLTAKQFRAELERAGLVCPSAHLQMNTTDLAPVFEDARTLGAHYAVCSAMLPPSASTDPTVDDYKKLASRLNELGRAARQFGLQYAYHNHNMEFRKLNADTIGYDVLLRETDPSLVDFEIDCGWMIAAGYDPIQYLRRYPRRIRMLHLKDFVRGSRISTSLAKDLRPQGTELGRGHIDYAPILKAAATVHVEHYFVEQEPPFLDMPALDAAKVDYDYLHRLYPFA